MKLALVVFSQVDQRQPPARHLLRRGLGGDRFHLLLGLGDDLLDVLDLDLNKWVVSMPPGSPVGPRRPSTRVQRQRHQDARCRQDGHLSDTDEVLLVAQTSGPVVVGPVTSRG